MSMLVGYKLEDQSGAALQQWGGIYGQTVSIPEFVKLPNGDVVYCPAVNVSYNGFTLVEWRMDPPPPSVPESITRRQCAVELRERTMITPQEALDMAKTAEPPAMVAQIFYQMTPEQSIAAQTDFAADSYYRSNPLLISIMTAVGATSEEIDAFFISAATR